MDSADLKNKNVTAFHDILEMSLSTFLINDKVLFRSKALRKFSFTPKLRLFLKEKPGIFGPKFNIYDVFSKYIH